MFLPVLALLLAACGGGGGDGTDTSSVTPVGREVHAVQVGAFSDSTLARRLADSLSMAGWQSYVATRADSTPHKVRVAPSPTAALADRAALALRQAGVDAMAIVDTAPVQPTVEAIPVNRGTHGMSSRVRWLVSPNGRSLLVVHDPYGVEAEALPNGFVFASERGDTGGLVLQRDSVWSVAPSPTWNRLAFGQAFILRAQENDTVMSDVWSATAIASGMPEDSVRANAYLVSGMANVYAYARPVIIDLEPSDSARNTGVTHIVNPLYVSGGWRIQWVPDGTQLAMGDAPIRVQDDSPPRNWLTYDIATGEVRGTISPSRLAPLDWRLGPPLDTSIPIDIQSVKPPLTLEGASIQSGGGWIRRDGRIVGPGTALAATRDGRFIVALAPRLRTRDGENTLEPVVYRVASPGTVR